MTPKPKKHHKSIKGNETRYEVTVWDIINGDIVKKLWNATAEEADEIRDQFEDEPFREVVVEERMRSEQEN